MANANKIVKHNLGGVVARLREQGKTVDQILEAINARLNGKDTISSATLRRFIDKLPEAQVVAVHMPEVAQEMGRQVRSFSDQFTNLNEIVEGWLEDVKNSKLTTVTEHGEVVDLGPDWNSRVKVARELREQIKLIADVMERVYNAEQIKLFQESVLEVISEASPEVASAIRDKLKERTDIRRAALLGV